MLFVRVVLSHHCIVLLCELCYSIITWFICESCAILSLYGLFVRVVLFFYVCESCTILSLQGYLWELCIVLSHHYMLFVQVFVVRVVLFYHYRVYLWELCYSIITWFICESCAILSFHVVCESCPILSLQAVCESCTILSLQGYLWELCYSIITWFIFRVVLSHHCIV